MIWVNKNNSLTWILRPLGIFFPLLTMISSEGEQWGRDEIYPDMMEYGYGFVWK